MVYISNQKSQFGKILEDPKTEKNTALGYILWSFGNFVVIWYICPVWVNCVEKNLAILITPRFREVLRKSPYLLPELPEKMLLRFLSRKNVKILPEPAHCCILTQTGISFKKIKKIV
jgi:hypothetical protein